MNSDGWGDTFTENAIETFSKSADVAVRTYSNEGLCCSSDLNQLLIA